MRKSPKNKLKEIIDRSSEYKSINVQLDHKTFITLLDMASLEVWRKRYPDAHVISS